MMGLMFGRTAPKHLVRGIAGAGIVKATGSKVTDVKVGDRINFIQSGSLGAMAEQILLTRGSVYAKIAANVSFAQAAPIPFGAMSAMAFMNEQFVKPGMKVFIYGASGSVGTYAVSLAKACGASVTASARSLHQAKLGALKANQWVDHSKGEHLSLQPVYDIVFDANGSFSEIKAVPLLALGGRYFSINSITSEQQRRLIELNKLAAKGKLPTVIDRAYPMDQFKQAHEYVYEGHKTGNVVLHILEPVAKVAPKATPKAVPKATPKQPVNKQPVKSKPQPKAPVVKGDSAWLDECNIVAGVIQTNEVVQTLGISLRTRKHNYRTGDAIRVALHPEDFIIDSNGPLKATVTSVGFRGVTYNIKCIINNQLLLMQTYEPYDVGQVLRASIKPEDVHLLPVKKA
jgi:NADPH:quinone reductase-like Zn-dependent oxidoreductase